MHWIEVLGRKPITLKSPCFLQFTVLVSGKVYVSLSPLQSCQQMVLYFPLTWPNDQSSCHTLASVPWFEWQKIFRSHSVSESFIIFPYLKETDFSALPLAHSLPYIYILKRTDYCFLRDIVYVLFGCQASGFNLKHHYYPYNELIRRKWVLWQHRLHPLCWNDCLFFIT